MRRNFNAVSNLTQVLQSGSILHIGSHFGKKEIAGTIPFTQENREGGRGVEMMSSRKLTAVIGSVLLSLMEVAERADFLKSHLPESWNKLDFQPHIFVGLIALLLFVAFSPEQASQQRGEDHPANIKNTNAGNASATGGSSVAKLADNLHTGAAPPVQPPGVSVPPPLPKRRPKILPKKRRIIWADTSDGNIFWEPEEKGKNSVKVIVAEFRNEPLGERSIPNWHGVQASIFYFDAKDEEISRVGAGAWIKEISPKVILPKFESRELIVAVRASDSWIAFDGSDTCKLPLEVRKAKIILHGESTESDIALQYLLEMDLSTEELGRFIPLTQL